jgi:N-methylhydantoinase B/oxoprolinase/acetone carboxylase alpha subunit
MHHLVVCAEEVVRRALRGLSEQGRFEAPELLEYRFPVALEEFSIRRHSGGGGNGTAVTGSSAESASTKP